MQTNRKVCTGQSTKTRVRGWENELRSGRNGGCRKWSEKHRALLKQ